MHRGQATAEYVAMSLLALVCACALVQARTPVERLALDLAHAVAHHPRRMPPHHARQARHTAVHRAGRPQCLCPLGSQSAPPADDPPG